MGPLAAYLERAAQPFELLPLSRFAGRGTLSQSLAAIATSVVPIARFLHHHSIELVHAQDGRVQLTWRIPAYVSGSRFIWHQRSMYRDSRLVDLMLHSVDASLCISRYVAASLPERYARKTTVVPNPFRLAVELSRAEARTRAIRILGCPADCCIIGFIGNLRPQKRPQLFLEAARRVVGRSRRETVFVVIGADIAGMRGSLRDFAVSSGLGSCTFFFDFQEPIEPWLAAFDILAAPAVDEGLGRTLVEAMLAETAIVAANSGGHAEVIEHRQTGLLVAPDDSRALAEAIASLVDDEDLRCRLTTTAVHAARGTYSDQRHADQIMMVYDRVRKGIEPRIS
jgi:glycosyltransferase involved in cell wall biosynthesis